MDDNSDIGTAARWFESVSSQLASQIVAMLEAEFKSAYALLPTYLKIALARSATEKAGAGYSGVTPPTFGNVGGASAVITAPNELSPRSPPVVLGASSANSRRKQTRRTKAAAKGGSKQGRGVRNRDAPGQMDLVEFLADPNP